MKSFKRIGFAMFIALSAINFSACSNDDPAEEQTVVPEITVPKGEENYFNEGLNFSTESNEQELTFTTNTDWTISVTETRNGSNWCKVVPNSGKAGTNTVKVITEENPTNEDRNVVLILTAGNAKKTIAVNQKQKDALTLTTNKFEVGAKGGDIKIEVKANINYEIEIPEACKGWISQKSKSRGMTTSNLTFAIAETVEADKREGEIIIKGTELSETVKVYQAGQKILLLTHDSYEVGAEEDTIKVEIKSNVNYEVKMPQVDWIHELTSSKAMSSHTLQYIISANETYDSRTAEIVYKDKDSEVSNTLKIKQSQKKGLIIKDNIFNVTSKGGKIEVKVMSNLDYDIDIDCDWITRTETRSLIENILEFNVQANDSDQPRNGKISFIDKNKTTLAVVEVRQGVTYKGEKRLVYCRSESVIVENNSPTMDERTTYKFTYDKEGRLTSSYEKNEEFYGPYVTIENHKYQWGNNQITYVDTERNDSCKHTLTNGLITETVMVTGGYREDFIYTYNANKTINSSSYRNDVQFIYNWDNFKLLGVNNFLTFIYKDTKTCRGYNIPLIMLVYGSGDTAILLTHPELYGLKSNYLPIKVYDDGLEYDLEYTMDTDGYIIKCVATQHADKRNVETVYFEWE